MGTDLKTIHLPVEEKRKTDPAQAKICFHTVVDNPTPDGPSKFDIKVTSPWCTSH